MPLAGSGPMRIFGGRKPEETWRLLDRRHAAYIDRCSYFYLLGLLKIGLVHTAQVEDRESGGGEQGFNDDQEIDVGNILCALVVDFGVGCLALEVILY